jgi:hypothetical protein
MAIAYVSEKPMYRIATPNAIPPTPYKTPSEYDRTIASPGASASTAPSSGMVSHAKIHGSTSQQPAACTSQYVCQLQR